MDLSGVEKSKHDEKFLVKIPSAINEKLAEETGIHIGDGSMNVYNGRFLYSLRGHRDDDCEYYTSYITSIYRELYNLDVKIRSWQDVIGFQKASKMLVTFKRHALGMPLGEKGDIQIPYSMSNDCSFACSCLRGILDTDGCIYLENRASGLYPRIEISSTSKPLIKQISFILNEFLKINNSCWIPRRPDGNWRTLYRVSIRGMKNMDRWFESIGSNNPKHLRKFERITNKN
ncbi:MAG: LAGLIDADG family homing endonuclease [Candidatus Aenigmatarchaeota archaeon]